MSKAAELRRLFAGDALIVAPGAYDGLTARLIELAGFPVVYATGAGISNSQLALADVGLVTMTEMLEQVRKMTAAVGHPTLRLVRVRIGGIGIGELPSGEWRELRAEERRLLFGR